MKEIKFTVTDPLGIHARPAGILVKEAKKFSSKITVWKGDKSCDMRKLSRSRAMMKQLAQKQLRNS